MRDTYIIGLFCLGASVAIGCDDKDSGGVDNGADKTPLQTQDGGVAIDTSVPPTVDQKTVVVQPPPIEPPPHAQDGGLPNDLGPKVGTQSCDHVLTCINQCPDTDTNCQYQCYYAGTAQAQKDYQAYASCFNKACPSLPCANGAQCGATEVKCLVDVSQSGTKNCAQVTTCLQGCNNDQTCVLACQAQGTAKALTQLYSAQLCITGLCGADPSQACAEQAKSGSCKTYLYDCFDFPAVGTEPAGVNRDNCTGTATSTGTVRTITPNVATSVVDTTTGFVGALSLMLFPNFATAGSLGFNIAFYPKTAQLNYSDNSVQCTIIALTGGGAIAKSQATACELRFTQLKHATAPQVCSGTLVGSYSATFANNQNLTGTFYIPSYVDETMLLKPPTP